MVRSSSQGEVKGLNGFVWSKKDREDCVCRSKEDWDEKCVRGRGGAKRLQEGHVEKCVSSSAF